MNSISRSKNIIVLYLIIGVIVSTLFINSPNNAMKLVSSDEISLNGSGLPNIVVMIGDGMGPIYEKIASLVEYGSPNGTVMEEAFPHKTLYNTKTIDNQITDSAAAGTAISTGVKTKKGYVGMDQFGHPLKTILEYLLIDANYSAGLITTTSIPHATPATFAAHVESRSNEGLIWEQEMALGIDVLMGGFGKQIYTKSASKIVAEVESNYGYPVATNVEEMYNLSNTSEKFVGLFGQNFMPYEIDRDPSIPSLLDMTKAALNLLIRKDNPFFLMIEGGRIDHAGHANNLTNAVIETIMFEKAVRYVRSIAEQIGNTIVVVIADHETCGLVLNEEPVFSNNTLPSYGFTREQNMTIRLQRISELNASFTAPYHTDWPVHFYGYGPGLEGSEQRVHHLTDIFWILNHALGDYPTIISPTLKVNGKTASLSVNITDLDNSVTNLEINIVYEKNNVSSYLLQINNPERLVVFNVTIIPEQDFDLFMRVIDPSSPFNTTSLALRYKSSSSDVTIPVETSYNNQTSLITSKTSFLFFSPLIIFFSSLMIISFLSFRRKIFTR